MTKKITQLRLRIFAGPNGSGKSTIIEAIRKYKIAGIPVDFGIYVNADEIAESLRQGTFNFAKYRIKVTDGEFRTITDTTGLIGKRFPKTEFESAYKIENTNLILLNPGCDEKLAQVISAFLQKKLLKEKKKFSPETVFSHESKLNLMKEAGEAGYKVYLYFVATESPEINKDRVKLRKAKGVHDVPRT